MKKTIKKLVRDKEYSLIFWLIMAKLTMNKYDEWSRDVLSFSTLTIMLDHRNRRMRDE